MRCRSGNQTRKMKLRCLWIFRTSARALKIVACSESRSEFSPRLYMS